VDELSVIITLRPERAADGVHVEGVVEVEGDRVPFTGWMALLSLLEERAEHRVGALERR
jgi:hypothetical protein